MISRCGSRALRRASELGRVCPPLRPPPVPLAAPAKFSKRQQEELHQALAQCPSTCLKLSTVSKFVAKSARTLEEEAAALDVHEARCLDYQLQEWDSAELDETLFLVLAVCYIARLCASGSERSACAATLGWDGGREQLDCMVDFARQELLSPTGIQRLASLDASKQEEEATEVLENLWAKFCSDRNIQVSSEKLAQNKIHMSFSPPLPYRMPSNGEFRWLSQGEKVMTSTTPRHSSYGIAAVPKLFGLVRKILNADFFLTFPVDKLGWNMLWNPHSYHRVTWAYAQLARHPLKPPAQRWYREVVDSYPLRISELVLLLQGITNNKLLRSLVTERPPMSVLPHHHAIWTGMQHARIWLGRYDLRIYYDQNLTYGRLGTQDATEEEEEEVFRNGFCMERTPSLVEHILRRDTHENLWGEGKILHMRPEDYDVVKPPDTPMWRAFRKYLGYCLEVPDTSYTVLPDIYCAFGPYDLCRETKTRGSSDGLFPPAIGEFSADELCREKTMCWVD